MTRINLLPWREMARKESKRQFISIGVGAVILMGVVILYAHIHMAGMIDDQNSRNTFLEEETARIDNQIKEIKNLETEKNHLLARMNVIQQLQSRRSQVVHIFDEIEKKLPAGVYLTAMKQEKGELILNGVAESNGDVSSFMRNLEVSDWFESPWLEVIQSINKSPEKSTEKAKEARYNNQFILHVKQSGNMDDDKETKDKKSKETKKT